MGLLCFFLKLLAFHTTFCFFYLFTAESPLIWTDKMVFPIYHDNNQLVLTDKLNSNSSEHLEAIQVTLQGTNLIQRGKELSSSKKSSHIVTFN